MAGVVLLLFGSLLELVMQLMLTSQGKFFGICSCCLGTRRTCRLGYSSPSGPNIWVLGSYRVE